MPREVQSPRSLVARTDAVLPPESGHEVAAGVADRRDPEFLHQVDDVLAEALRIGRRMPRLMDARVDVAAEMLDETAEQASVDRADGRVRVDREVGGEHGASYYNVVYQY